MSRHGLVHAHGAHRLIPKQTKVARGLAVLRKYGANAHLWWPGIGYFNGQQLGNFLDIAGATAATVDNPVGLILDQTSGGGLLATTNLSPTLNTTNWTPTGGWSITNGNNTAANSGTTGAITTVSSPLSVGSWYKVTFTSGAPAMVNAVFGNNYVSITAVAGTNIAYGQCTVNGQFALQGGGPYSGIGSIVIQQVLGAPATQATTSSKPTLRRGLVNLLSYSNDLTNAAWGVQNSATQNAGVMSFPAVGAQWYHASVLPTGVPVTHAVKLSGSGTVSIFFWNATDGNIGVKSVTLTSTPTIYTTSATLSAASYCYIGRVGTDTATSVTFGGAGNFIGNLTDSQINAAGGIPVTLAAPVSSMSGNYGWHGDGTKSIGFSGPLLTSADDCAVIAGARLDVPAGAAYYSILAPAANTSTASRAGVLAIAPGNIAQVYWTNDANTFFNSNAGTITPGQAFVLSGVQRSGVAKGRLNGGAWGNTVNPTGATTVNAGGFMAAQGFASWNGVVYPSVVVKGNVSDSDLLAIERLIAAATGAVSGSVVF